MPNWLLKLLGGHRHDYDMVFPAHDLNYVLRCRCGDETASMSIARQRQNTVSFRQPNADAIKGPQHA